MIKKLFLIVLTLFATAQAQDLQQESCDLAFQELIYDIGMSLAVQNLIVDNVTARDAMLNVYEDVEQVTQIVDLFLMIDEEMVELEITTIDALVDYEMQNHKKIAESCIAWLFAYQNLFKVFVTIHPQDNSFEVWCDDVLFISSLEEGQELEDLGYAQLWQASYDVLEAQSNFEETLKSCRKRLE